MVIKFKLNGAVCDACYKLASKRLAKINGFLTIEKDKDNNLTLSSDRDISLVEINEALKETDYKAEAV